MPEQDAPWTKDEPFTKEQIDAFNAFTHFPSDINKEFRENVRTKEQKTMEKLREYGITEAPDDVKKAGPRRCPSRGCSIRKPDHRHGRDGQGLKGCCAP